jgi:hypothetical protein
MNRTVKLKGTNLFSKERWGIVRKAVLKVNLVVIKASMLAKTYYISQDHELALDADFYDLCIKVVTNTSLSFRGTLTPEKESKQDIYYSMQTIFQQGFGAHINLEGMSLSNVFAYVSAHLETMALNNIQFHYPKYLNLYMRKYLETKQTIMKARNHLLYRTECPTEITEWMNEHKPFMIPLRDETSFEKDIQKRPWLYLSHMVKIVKHVEENFPEAKLLSPLIMRKSYIPKHIHLDTNALVQLLMKSEDIKEYVKWYELQYGAKPNIKTKGDLGSSFKKIFGRDPKDAKEDFLYQQSFWLYLCRFEHPNYKKIIASDLSFGNSINTDGCSVSLLMVSEQEKKKFSVRKVKPKKKAADEFCHELKEDTLFLGCDPGKNDLVAMTDGSHTFKYTKGQRHRDCQIKKYTRRSYRLRDELVLEGDFQSKTALVPGYYVMLNNPTLLQYENQVLSGTSSKSCQLEPFLRYVKAKLFMEDTVSKLYATPRYRNDRFSNYVLVKSSEDKMLNRLETFVKERHQKKANKCHDDVVNSNVNMKSYRHVNIFYGDWGRNPNLKNQGPTPGIGLRRKINTLYNTITVSEHYTSKTCPCCKERTLANFKLDGSTRLVSSKHHLLCCTNCSSWWNRNWAGAYNILLKGLKAGS